MNAASPKRTSLDVEVAIKRATARDWLQAQREFEMTRTEMAEDEGVMVVFLCYLLDTSADRSVAKWLDTSTEDSLGFLNMDEDELPKAQESAA